MVKVVACVAVDPSVSFACTTIPVKGLPTAVLGVPVMTPVAALRLSGIGRGALPPVSIQVYGGVPPCAVRWKENGRPTSPTAVLPEVTSMLFTVSVNACGAEVCGPTVTATLKL
jgi:hypothetical protein